MSPFRNVNSWVALKKIEGPEFELVPTCGQYRPVFRPNHVMKSERIPQYKIGILNPPIGVRPSWKTVTTCALVRIGSGSVSLLEIIGCHPEMKVSEASP